MENNIHKVTGIIYEIRRRPYKSQKGDGEFVYVKLEISRSFKSKKDGVEKYVTVKETPEFRIGWGIDMEPYSEGDLVELTFSLRGKDIEWKDKITAEKKNKHITEIEVLYMKFGTMESGETAKPKKVDMKPLSNTDDLKAAQTFKGAIPGEDEEDFTDLPF